MKLYKVTCRGMTHSLTGMSHGIAYVLAENAGEAYTKLRSHLDTNDFGFVKERELDKVELIADGSPYPDCGMRLL